MTPVQISWRNHASTCDRYARLSVSSVPSIFNHFAARDKQFVLVEGATHGFTPCRPEYGDTLGRRFDDVDAWLTKAGRSCARQAAVANGGRASASYAYAAPTIIFLILMYGDPCEMLLVCVG